MNRRRYLAALSAGAATALAGCTGGDGGGANTTAAPTTAAPTTAEPTTAESTTGEQTTQGGDATVHVRTTDEYGDVLVDAEGMSLYLFDPDEQGASTCYGDCAQNWPPLTVDGDPVAGDAVTAELGTTERDDGSAQVTANDWPLYYFAGDEQPGDTNGQGVGDVWWLLAPDGSRVTGSGGETTTAGTTTAEPTTTTAEPTTTAGGGGY